MGGSEEQRDLKDRRAMKTIFVKNKSEMRLSVRRKEDKEDFLSYYVMMLILGGILVFIIAISFLYDK